MAANSTSRSHQNTLCRIALVRDSRRCFLSLFKRRPVNSWKEGEEVRASFPPRAADNLPELLSEIDAALAQRLHPLVVEEILGITASKRRRWTKDGRLPQSGIGSFGCGRQSIHFPLHPATKIAKLAPRPERSKPGDMKTKNSLLAKIQNEKCAFIKDFRRSNHGDGADNMRAFAAVSMTVCPREKLYADAPKRPFASPCPCHQKPEATGVVCAARVCDWWRGRSLRRNLLREFLLIWKARAADGGCHEKGVCHWYRRRQS